MSHRRKNKMGICWDCYWGWVKPVADIYLEAVKRLDGCDDALLYSSAHVVWADENFDSAEKCLESFDEYKNEDFSNEEHAIVRWSLEELAKIPVNERDACPDDYDGRNPKNFPPPEGLEMIRIR
jgi:hypothetical protein